MKSLVLDWNPVDLPGLELWLRNESLNDLPEGSEVKIWLDSSPHRRDRPVCGTIQRVQEGAAGMTVRHLIRKLCEVQEFVSHRFLGHSEPNDCICGKGGFWEAGQWPSTPPVWRSSGRAVDYIVLAAKFCALSKIPPDVLARVVDRLETDKELTR